MSIDMDVKEFINTVNSFPIFTTIIGTAVVVYFFLAIESLRYGLQSLRLYQAAKKKVQESAQQVVDIAKNNIVSHGIKNILKLLPQIAEEEGIGCFFLTKKEAATTHEEIVEMEDACSEYKGKTLVISNMEGLPIGRQNFSTYLFGSETLDSVCVSSDGGVDLIPFSFKEEFFKDMDLTAFRRASALSNQYDRIVLYMTEPEKQNWIQFAQALNLLRKGSVFIKDVTKKKKSIIAAITSNSQASPEVGAEL